jgi:hypothetical protein
MERIRTTVRCDSAWHGAARGAPKKRPLARRGLIVCSDYESKATRILIN